MSTINENVVRGFIFIVPNSACTASQLFPGNLRDITTSANHFPSNWAIRGDELLIEVWMGDQVKNNWQDHSTPANFPIRRMPNMIPARILRGLKEGDIISFTCGNVQVELSASQTITRYRNCGTFQQAFRQVTGENKVDIDLE